MPSAKTTLKNTVNTTVHEPEILENGQVIERATEHRVTILQQPLIESVPVPDHDESHETAVAQAPGRTRSRRMLTRNDSVASVVSAASARSISSQKSDWSMSNQIEHVLATVPNESLAPEVEEVLVSAGNLALAVPEALADDDMQTELQVFIPGSWDHHTKTDDRNGWRAPFRRGVWKPLDEVFPENLLELTRVELRLRCGAFNMNTSGTKAQLVERLSLARRTVRKREVRKLKVKKTALKKPVQGVMKKPAGGQVRRQTGFQEDQNQDSVSQSCPIKESDDHTDWREQLLPCHVKYQHGKVYLKLCVPKTLQMKVIYTRSDDLSGKMSKARDVVVEFEHAPVQEVA